MSIESTVQKSVQLDVNRPAQCTLRTADAAYAGGSSGVGPVVDAHVAPLST